ncbi:MAG: branched-chain amino acid ABC transporter permease [Chloroflexi bacterium]|nr:branched-chain amino acid ABC transporter permease [Chloroflexota bacterium]
MTSFFQNVVNALQWGSFYALIALGYSMVYGILLLFNFAHGDIFMVGAYIGFFVATGLLALFAAGSGALILPMWLILILTILITMFLTSFLGMLVERIGYRPLRDAPRASAAITGLMIGIILETGILAIFGAQRMKFPDLMAGIDALAQPNLGGVLISWKKVLIVGVAIGLMILLQLFVSKTKWGMAMRAMAYDFAAVPLMGVPLNRIASLTFAIGSALAAAAAVLYSIAYPVLDPYMGITVGWKAFVAAILGGRGSIKGAAIAGFLLGFIEIFSATLFPSTYRDLIAYSIILIILVFRPHGLFGEEYTSKLRL